METRTRLLSRAAEIWQDSLTSDADIRLVMMLELRDMGLFSNRQIAKIARVSTRTVNMSVVNRSGGGRFNPACLSALVIIREMVIDGRELPMRLIKGIVDDGTSISNLCKLTGAARSDLYRKIKEA